MKKRIRINAIAIGALVSALAWAAAPAFAQAPAPAPEPNAPGKIRIQGQDIEEKGPQIEEDPNALLDMGEEMRKFVQKISRFARKYKRSFQILTSNNLELMVKYEDVDKLKPAPAKTYIRSIDGILLEGLFYGEKIFGQPARDVRIKQQLAFAKIAQNNGVRILVVDYVKDRKLVDDSYRRNRANKFVSFAAHARDLELNTLPTYPSRPRFESSKNVLSMKDVRNFVMINDGTRYGNQAEYTLKMHDTNYDLLLVDVFHGREPLTRRAVETLKYKKIGAKRLVMARIDIGSAASYRYYWKPRWREGSPSWINAPYPGDPDRYYVQYWRPEWQKLIAGDTKSFIYGIIAQGFDGVVLSGMNSYRYFMGEEEREEDEELRQ
jgi:cysteinyl-tRNA synthetase, unknown class